ncbi:hypothetical protein ABG067_002124 [Albugo candida]
MLATIAEQEAQTRHIMEQQVKHMGYLEQNLLAEKKRWERDKIAAVESVQDTLKHDILYRNGEILENVLARKIVSLWMDEQKCIIRKLGGWRITLTVSGHNNGIAYQECGGIAYVASRK